jgi:hypothetical protein
MYVGTLLAALRALRFFGRLGRRLVQSRERLQIGKAGALEIA